LLPFFENGVVRHTLSIVGSRAHSVLVADSGVQIPF